MDEAEEARVRAMVFVAIRHPTPSEPPLILFALFPCLPSARPTH
jgi:hypothetical protein